LSFLFYCVSWFSFFKVKLKCLELSSLGTRNSLSRLDQKLLFSPGMAVLLKYPLHCLLRSLANMSYDPLFHIHLLVICKLYSLSSLTEHKSPVHWRLLTSQKKHPWSCIWIFTWAWNKRGKRLKTLLMNLRLVQGWVIYSGLGIILLVWFSGTLMSMCCVTCNLSKTLLACILLLSQCCSWTVLLSNCYSNLTKYYATFEASH